MTKLVSSYWPEMYADIKEFIKLAATEDVELALLEQAELQQLADGFVMTASLPAIKRRERMLGIQADPNAESIDFRRRRIVNRYSTKPPFTMRYLQERLDFLVGAGRGIAAVDVQNFILTVTAAIDDANIFKEVERTVSAIKPANIVYRQQTAIMDGVVLKERIAGVPLVRNTRLGSWKLGVTPFTDREAEVVVK
ncbi:phage portal protein [Paenibacillus sp. BIHB 4019]|uniref:Phage portal protein n=1 Tax=Paenibacillus sp. BIHB 4019 TaxID=1870819 RepID=A0A1B2DIP4_9BACL|nr:putative phage tail protein [Paenibacillus sp. BIHB 4019]ANY67588.1 phage portal protein [Paenibacillus sp. BIHB 4019]